MKSLQYFNILLCLCLLLACGDDETSTDDDGPNTNPEEVPAVYQKIYGASDIFIDGDFIVIQTEGRPDHKSPYYRNTQWESSLFEAYNGNNPDFNLNPNRIAAFDFEYRIPKNPSEASNKRATSLGSIGIALNGVSFYNQYAGPNNQPLTDEINSFDQHLGHPQQAGVYHYHIEPTYLTSTQGQDALLGFLLDGFPVYGPMENGTMVTNADLDQYHGHSHATEDFPNGIYHYHITAEDPYLNGAGYYGTPGTVTN